jgi:dihydropteroate synthase
LSAIINSKNRQLDLTLPVVMGIINTTPDSFYTKGHGADVNTLLGIVAIMLKDGASILDIGGASTKPGQALIDPEVELSRVIPAIEAIRKHYPDVWLSVDTYNSKVARDAVNAGADIVNDVSAGRFDKEMLPTVGKLKVPYIAMHMQGTPATMQVHPEYDDVVSFVYGYLQAACIACADAGITDVILDPGFGFGKTVEHNFELLHSMHELTTLGKPILAGLSRKSMICKPLKVNPAHALNGTTALNMVALQQGANILRVHDVKEAREVIELFKLLNS